MDKAHLDLLTRLGTALSGDVDLSRSETEAIWDEVEALVAEVERLRREIDNRREMWSQVLVVLAQVLEQQEHRRA